MCISVCGDGVILMLLVISFFNSLFGMCLWLKVSMLVLVVMWCKVVRLVCELIIMLGVICVVGLFVEVINIWRFCFSVMVV